MPARFPLPATVAVAKTALAPRGGAIARCLSGVLLCAAAIFQSAALAEAEKDELEVWVLDGHAEKPFYLQLIEEFRREFANTGIELRLKALPGYNDAIEVAWLGDDLPDVVMIDGPNMARYVWHGILQPIDGMIEEDTLAQLLPGIIAQGRYPPDRRIYMLGAGDSSIALWANRDHLERAGIEPPRSLDEAWSAEEFTEALDRLSRVEGVRWPLDFKLGAKGEWRLYGYYPLLRSAGGELIDEVNWRARGTLDARRTQEAAATLYEWVRQGYTVPASAGDSRFFGDRSAALSWTGNWVYRSYSEALGDKLLALPAPKLGERVWASNGGWGWAVPASAKNVRGAAHFLNFVLSKEQVKAWSRITGYIPARLDAMAEMPLFAPGGPMHIFAEQARKAYLVRPVHPAYPVISREFGKALANIFAGADIAPALERASREIDWDIEDNRRYPPFGQASRATNP